MTVRFGIVGLGGIARRFARVLSSEEGVELEAVAAHDTARAEAFAHEHGAARAHADYEALATDERVQAVYIANTHNFHFESARLFLEHGKAVLCEKPMVTTLHEAETLVALARERRVLLMEAMWTRCLPAVRKAREWVLAGRIGPPSLLQASFSFLAKYHPEHRLFNPDLAGGSLYDVGVYPLALAIGVLNEHPTRVAGVCVKGQTGVDECVAMSLAFPGGALASLSCGFRAVTDRDARIFGPLGCIVIRNFPGATLVELCDPHGNKIDWFEESCADGFVYQIRHFAELYRAKHTESNIMPLADTIACASVFDQLIAQWKG